MRKTSNALLIVLILMIGISCSKDSGPAVASEAENSLLAQSLPKSAKAEADETEPGSGPKIEFANLIHEFGRVKGGDVIHHTFVFKNTGDRQLEIKSVRPSCGCTVAGNWTRTVPPGGSGKIPVKIDTKTLKGNVSKTVKISTNIPGKSLETVWLKGIVWHPIELIPRIANLGSLQTSGETVTKTVRIVSNLESPLEITNVRSDNPAFRAEVNPTKPGKEFELTVTNVPPHKTGSIRLLLSGNILIETSNPEKPEITVLARAYVLPRVQVRPGRVMIPSSPLENPFQRTLYVIHNAEAPLTISDVQIASKDVSLRTVVEEPGKRFRIQLNFSEGFEIPDNSSLSLKFKTDDPEFPEVDVPISVRRSRPRPALIQPVRRPPPNASQASKGTPPQAN